MDSPQITVEIEHARTLTFALEQAGVPIVSSIVVRNGASAPLEGASLSLGLAPDLGAAVQIPVPTLHGGESLELGVIDLPLPPGRLRAVTEAERAQLTWRLVVAGQVLAEGSKPVELLAYNEWPGVRAPPALLAVFVTPNHPVVALLLRHVRDRLGRSTGDNALSGYQSRSPERVTAMVTALYETLQGFGVSYAEAPASFEEIGQKVRFPDRVLGDQLANCLDLTLLVASCLEQMGLHPLLAIVRGHAFPGVWLIDDRFPEGVVNDAARLRTCAALGQLLFFDSSTLVHTPPPPFSLAKAVATDALADDAAFGFAVDVRAARTDRYRPLPLRDIAPLADTHAPADSVSPEARTLLLEAAALPWTEPTAPAPRPALDPVAARLKQWRDRLLDLSLRNRLLSFRRDGNGALALQIPDLAAFEDALSEEKAFDLLPRPSDARDARDPSLSRARSDDAEIQARRLADFKQGIVHCPLPDPEMRARVLHLDRSARADLEEGGASTLYAAIGLLRWYESDDSDKPRYAPLLLVPVALDYQRLTRRTRLRGLPEEAVPNVTLVEKLQRDFNLDLGGLANVEADEHGRDVAAMFRSVREAIKSMPRWEVREEVELGLFTFTKFLMWRDLGENAAAILENPVVKHIASGATTAFPNAAPATDPRALDDTVSPAHLPMVLDADSTQMAAVASALAGRCFVLQGPPGTGKSQTITNLIAASLAEGRTVLFVSEKMAALDVVKRRLEQAGLGDFCVELHSHKAQKKQVVESFGRSLLRSTRTAAPPWEERSAELARLRVDLNTYARAIHAPRPLGKTFHQASARLLALAAAPKAPADFPAVTATTEAQLRALLDAASAYCASAREIDPVAAHPYHDTMLTAWSAQGEQTLQREVQSAIQALAAVDEAGQRLAASIGLPRSPSLTGLDELAALGTAAAAGPIPTSLLDDRSAADLRKRALDWLARSRALAERRRDLATRWQPAFTTTDLPAQEALFRRWAGAFFLFAWLFLWSARSRLKAVSIARLPDNRRIASDLTAARAAGDAARELAEERAALIEALGNLWSGEIDEDPTPLLQRGEAFRAAQARYRASSSASLDRARALTDPALSPERRAAVVAHSHALVEACAALREHIKTTLTGLQPRSGVWPEDTSPAYLEAASALLARWQRGFPSFRAFSLYRTQAALFASHGTSAIIAAHEIGALAADDLVAATERAFLQAWIDTVRDAEPALRTFDGPNRHRLVDRFRALDREHLTLGRQRIAGLLEARLPPVDAAHSEASETGKLQREIRKKTRHLPIRRLLAELPNLAPRLKPCFLMSPLSVAQYLPPGGRLFDLVVFDEASQICTHDAIGAIARGRQVVVVGDSRQLPPTSFFQRGIADDAPVDDNDVHELESILDESLAAGLPQQMLGWHYRSRHEALIDFSNEHYYEGRLNVFPAARGRVPELGVEWHPVPDGVYAKGTTRTNPKEAEALVAHLVTALRSSVPGERTFGVVTFSLAQQLLIEELLDEARGKSAALESHFAASLTEPVFIKNLESVQGDERDEILFSIGYGPDESRKVWMNFGPLNRTGGERRLNVAITRARQKLRVFSTLTHEQIDLARTGAVGARHLKAFLRYVAERTRAATTRPLLRSGDFDSDFEREIHDALIAAGHEVDCQVGCGAYRIDLGVVHPEKPGVYLLGIECDGASYHSGATARDRDRLRHQVLEGLGWRLHRIWSSDWWFSRDREIARLIDALRRAREDAARPQTPRPPIAILDAETAVEPFTPTPISAAPISGAPASPTVPYVKAELSPAPQGIESIHEVSGAHEATRRALDVLSIEAPIHVDELTRRVLASFGAARITDRGRARILDLLRLAPNVAVIHGDFVWRRDQPRDTWSMIRGPSSTGEIRAAELIPDEEIAAAAAWILARCLSTTRDDLLRQTARIFGIARAGTRVAERMQAGIDTLEARGHCATQGDRVEWRGDTRPRTPDQTT
jgi:very-short-patch-repair endonuclease/preprotein translocase subunit Sec61beta